MSSLDTNNLINNNPELKEQLRVLALTDFDAFLQLIAVDGLQLFICADRNRGLSLQQIVNRLSAQGVEIGRSTVKDRCDKCTDAAHKKGAGRGT